MFMVMVHFGFDNLFCEISNFIHKKCNFFGLNKDVNLYTTFGHRVERVHDFD